MRKVSGGGESSSTTPRRTDRMLHVQHPTARILVIDDEELNLRMMSQMLRLAGYDNVTIESDSSRAVERFLDEVPDLVLLDLHMPQPDGFAVLEQIREQTGSGAFVPVLVLTGDATADSTEDAFERGANDLLIKPFRRAEMLLRVGNLLTIADAHRQVIAHDELVTRQLEVAQAREHGIADELRVATELVQTVLSDDLLTIVFQPIVDLVDGEVVGLEALARFPGDPPRPPDVWFLDAARVGLGVDLELHAISLAVAGFAALGTDIDLSVNLSAPTLLSPRLDAVLDEARPSSLILELTEHDQIDDYEMLGLRVEELRARGMRLAVDDTGSGYASLNHILRLKPDVIKLDRMLVTGVDQDPVRRSLIASLVHFADENGTQLIGEGIETLEELRTLRTLGLGCGQGYLLCRPAADPPLVIEELSFDEVVVERNPLRLPVPSDAGPGELGRALHDGPVQDLSAACLHLQLLQQSTSDDRSKTDLAMAIGLIRRGVLRIGELMAAAGETPGERRP